MPLQIEWGDENKTYIYSRFTPNWTWDDFYANADEYVAMLKSVSHRVDFVGDFSDAPLLPTNIFNNARHLHNERLANEGYIILVNAGSIIQGLYGFAKRVIPNIQNYVIFVKTMDEALSIVQGNRNENPVQP